MLLSYDELFVNSSGGVDRVSREGTELGSPTRAFVEIKSTLNTDWMLADWPARLSLRCWSPSQFMEGGWTFTVGVNNLFDEDPPICFSCDLNSLDGTVYPIAGQFLYARFIYEN